MLCDCVYMCVCKTCVLRNPSVQVKWNSLSLSVAVSPTLCDPDPMDYSPPESLEFSRQEYWSGLPFPSLGDLPHPGIEPRSSASQADSWPSEPSGKPHPYYNQYTLQVTRLRNEGLFSPRGDDFPRIVCPGGLGSSVCQYTHIVLWLQKLMVWMKAQPFDNWCLHKAPLYMWVAGCWVKQTTETVLETGILSAA